MVSFEELMNRMKEWNEEKNRKSEANHQEHLKNMERMNRKHEAEHHEHLEYMERMDREIDEMRNGPPIPHPIVSCSIPSPPVQEISSLQVYI